MGEHPCVFFFISSEGLKITTYHIADTRETLPAFLPMKEAIVTAHPEHTIILAADGNPSYPAGIHILNEMCCVNECKEEFYLLLIC